MCVLCSVFSSGRLWWRGERGAAGRHELPSRDLSTAPHLCCNPHRSPLHLPAPLGPHATSQTPPMPPNVMSRLRTNKTHRGALPSLTVAPRLVQEESLLGRRDIHVPHHFLDHHKYKQVKLM
jgi:hypothetical protein